MDRSILHYYRQKQGGGRAAAARAVDAIALRLLFVAASYLWFRAQVPNALVVYVLTGVTSLLFFFAAHLWTRLRFDRFVERERERLREEAALEELLLAPRDRFRRMVLDLAWTLPEAQDAYLAAIHQAGEIGPDAVLRAYHAAQQRDAKRILLCCAAPCTAQAEALCSRLPLPTKIFPPQRLARALMETGMLTITDEMVEARIRSMADSARARRRLVQTQPFAAGRAMRYLICAGLLMALSFLGGYALYYRLLAGVCLLLAAITRWLNETGKPHAAQQ